MFSTATSINTMDHRQYIVYTTAILIIAFGLYKARGVIPFLLDKLYEQFIQNNPSLP
jgi:hypothetical protein